MSVTDLHLSTDPMIAASQLFDHHSAEARKFVRCAANAARIDNQNARLHFQRKARQAAVEARAAAAVLRRGDVDPLAPLAALLEYAGWELKDVEIDISADQSRLRVHVARYDRDGGALHVDLLVEAHLGRASISREVRKFNERQKNGRLWTGGWDYRFLGRQRYEDGRAALAAFQRYVEDNGNGRRLGGVLAPMLLPAVAR